MDQEDTNDSVEKAIRQKEVLLKNLKKKGPSNPKNVQERLPPGQRLQRTGWPVMDIGKRPEMDIESNWKLTATHKGKQKEFALAQIKSLGSQNYTSDFHCVTTWSKFAGSKWRFLIQYGKDNYSTNCPRADVEDENCFLAYEHEGQPIPRDHGYIRIIIPQLYGWKSCKWLEKIEFVDEDQPGFWETRGYSNTANVWTEERYS